MRSFHIPEAKFKDYRERTVHRCITNNKHSITNMAVLTVSE